MDRRRDLRHRRRPVGRPGARGPTHRRRRPRARVQATDAALQARVGGCYGGTGTVERVRGAEVR